MAIDPIVALEIGTTKVLAIVGEVREDGHAMITGIGETQSAGVRKGEIFDFDNALSCVRLALQAAEENAQVEIRSVHLGISGGHIQSLVNRGTIPVNDPEGEITGKDVSQVMDVARAVNLPADREIMHSICQHFYIDDQEEVVRPEGMEGARLALDMLLLHGVRNRLHNPVRVVRSVPMDVTDIVFSGLCSAMAVLTPEQKESGVLLIDLGGGTTDYVAYAASRLAAAGALGVGGDHVTNDVSLAFGLSTRQAEKLKRESGSATIELPSRLKQIGVAPDGGFEGRTVTLGSLHTVINARMEETLQMVRTRIKPEDLRQMGAGVVVTGGGAHMRGIRELAEKVFRLPCAMGRMHGVSGLASATEGPEYATAVGLVRYGFKTASQKTSRLERFLGRLFGGIEPAAGRSTDMERDEQ